MNYLINEYYQSNTPKIIEWYICRDSVRVIVLYNWHILWQKLCKSIKCINLSIAQQNEVIPWYTKTNMDIYKQFYNEYVCFPYPFYVIYWLIKIYYTFSFLIFSHLLNYVERKKNKLVYVLGRKNNIILLQLYTIEST